MFPLLKVKQNKKDPQTGKHSVCVLPFNAKAVFGVISVGLKLSFCFGAPTLRPEYLGSN